MEMLVNKVSLHLPSLFIPESRHRPETKRNDRCDSEAQKVKRTVAAGAALIPSIFVNDAFVSVFAMINSIASNGTFEKTSTTENGSNGVHDILSNANSSNK